MSPWEIVSLIQNRSLLRSSFPTYMGGGTPSARSTFRFLGLLEITAFGGVAFALRLTIVLMLLAFSVVDVPLEET